MAKLTVTGRLGEVKEVKNGFVKFSVAEPDYKGSDGNYITPWWNFMLPGTTKSGKPHPMVERLKKLNGKAGVVTVNANIRQVASKNEDGTYTERYFVNPQDIEVVTWKKSKNGEPSETTTVDDTSNSFDDDGIYPWDQTASL